MRGRLLVGGIALSMVLAGLLAPSTPASGQSAPPVAGSAPATGTGEPMPGA